MKKQRIVLASVLKPVDDTRMFEKFGKSLSSNSNYDVFIIGYPTQTHPNDPKIHFFQLPNFVRLSLKRILIPVTTLNKIYKVKPDVLIVNTHELLIVAVVIRILFGCKIIYDIQENYWRNILWTDSFPPFFRQVLAIWVRAKEIILSGFFDLFILAEKGFKKEMKFFGNKFIVLENKSDLPEGFVRAKTGGAIKLLFSGTISESTGVFQAINLANRLHQFNESVQLHIIGYCAVPSTLQKVRDLIHDKSFISLTGGDQLVPHQEIISHIRNADFGIIYYPPSPHIENKIPTKLYEYLSAQLPLLIQDNMPWAKLCETYQAAISVNFNSIVEAGPLLSKMKQSNFYKTNPKDVFWSSEEKRLLKAIRELLV